MSGRIRIDVYPKFTGILTQQPNGEHWKTHTKPLKNPKEGALNIFAFETPPLACIKKNLRGICIKIDMKLPG